MLRQNPGSSMQKTYDEAYLSCSTAIYFEQQNNEEEALRSWREALDQIYYHNAYKVPVNYHPKSETEKALQGSLRDMELQCRERLDLLETLKKSRSEPPQTGRRDPTSINGVGSARRPDPTRINSNPPHSSNGTIGQGTIPAANYPDVSRPSLPHRQAPGRTSPLPKANMAQPSGGGTSGPKPPPTTLKPPSQEKKPSRSPSPEKKGAVLKSTLRADRKDGQRAPKLAPTLRPRMQKPASQAASLAWPTANQPSTSLGPANKSTTSLSGSSMNNLSRSGSIDQSPRDQYPRRKSSDGLLNSSTPSEPFPPQRGHPLDPNQLRINPDLSPNSPVNPDPRRPSGGTPTLPSKPPPPPPPPHRTIRRYPSERADSYQAVDSSPNIAPPPPPYPTYRKEYPTPTPIDPRKVQSISKNPPSQNGPESQADLARKAPRPPVPRKPVSGNWGSSPNHERDGSFTDHSHSSSGEVEPNQRPRDAKKATEEEAILAELPSEDVDSTESEAAAQDARIEHLMKNLPKGVDEQAAKSIFNEIVVKGDEVHWVDVAGLEAAKSALKEAVVYPFLRPDLFMGLREPARGMLLFGPPGTGKTMLARAVATESKSTFFAISASSLTSKFLGESEKLVRALFTLAKALAPSIIFVDEIDSLLSARAGSGEHEATRRIKTEFLIQWSDLQRAAAGKEQNDKIQGDASRVLVLAATNLPWAIDEAARRRFVRRQYIPLPEDHVRGEQLRWLMNAQKHKLDDHDIDQLIELTDGFSGSDITALAKDAAMGPLRSLGEQLLSMSPDEIRPIMFQDFEASLVNIRPSVGKQGLKEYEDWAKEFGERGG